jgi:deoxycytidylate deaminase
MIHAEMNALLHAKTDLFGTSLYCTHHPCISGGCLKHIIACGISRVVYLYDYDAITDRERCVVRNLVSASGIKFIKYNNA